MAIIRTRRVGGEDQINTGVDIGREQSTGFVAFYRLSKENPMANLSSRKAGAWKLCASNAGCNRACR